MCNLLWAFYLTSGKMHSQAQCFTKIQGTAYKMVSCLSGLLSIFCEFFVMQNLQNNWKRVGCSNATETKEQVGLQMPWAHQKVGGFSCSCSWQLQPDWCWLGAVLLCYIRSVHLKPGWACTGPESLLAFHNTYKPFGCAGTGDSWVSGGSNENQVIHSTKTGK